MSDALVFDPLTSVLPCDESVPGSGTATCADAAPPYRTGADHAPKPLPGTAAIAPGPPDVGTIRPLGEMVEELERRAIDAALRATRGNKLAAARLLRISRTTLYEKLAAWSPPPP